MTMKANRTLALLSIALFGTAVCAQNPLLNLTDETGTAVNGTTIQINAEVGDTNQTLGMSLHAENTSGVERLMNVKRYETNVLHGTANYFCWDLCYGQQNAGVMPVWVGADPIPMSAGATANGFHAYYKPKSLVGTSTFRYVWYDVNSPNDSTWVDFVFNVTEQVGIEEDAVVRGFTAWPNPSVGGNLTFSYELAAAVPGTRLVLYNMLGERKRSYELAGSQGKVVLAEGELPAGAWFASLERNGKSLVTKRVVVAR
jgi:hypothetical protein